MSFDASPYVGLPFIKREPGVDGFECWDLVHRVYAEVARVELPLYGEITAKDLTQVAAAFDDGMASEVWTQALVPRSLDVAVMRVREKGVGLRNRHCGVMVDATSVLHLEVNTDSVVVPITHGSVRFRLVGFFRHRDLA